MVRDREEFDEGGRSVEFWGEGEEFGEKGRSLEKGEEFGVNEEGLGEEWVDKDRD